MPESSDVDPWALLDESDGALVVIDSQGTVRYVNQVLRRVLAPAEEEIEIGADFFARLLPRLGDGDDIVALGRATRAALNGRRGQVLEVLIVGAAGPTWLSARLTPMAQGDGRIVMVNLTDVTSKKKTEDALLKITQKLEHHLLQSPLALIEWNARAECLEWNPAAEKIFGYTRAEVLGQRGLELIVREDGRQLLEQQWAELLKGGRLRGVLHENQRKDGTLLLCEWFNIPLEDHEGRVVGISSIVQDVTERKRTMELLRQSAVVQTQKAEMAEGEAREKDRLLRELDQKLEIIADQHRQIVELSMPILELWDDVLAVPIIGEVDVQRGAAIMDRLLPAIVAKRARYVILDLTGVQEVDVFAAEQLTRVIQAVALLGASGVLTGIRPAVAQTMIALGVDLSAIATFRSLREGLKAVRRGALPLRAA